MLARIRSIIVGNIDKRKIIRRELQNYSEDLIEKINLLLENARQVVQKKRNKELLIMQDNLDRLIPDVARQLFIDNGEQLKKPQVHMIYTKPPAIVLDGYSNRRISDRGMQNQLRLKKKIDDLRQSWELLNEKLSGLNKDWILETRFDEKLRLRKSIDDTKIQFDQIEEQLNTMENQLAKVDSDAKEGVGRNDDQGPPRSYLIPNLIHW